MPVRRTTWALLVMACSAFALCSVYSWYPARREFGAYGPGFAQAAMWELLRWNLWLPIAALIIRWEWRFRGRRAATVGTAIFLFPAIHTVLLVALYLPLVAGNVRPFLRYRAFVFFADFLSGMIVSGLVFSLVHARRASRLEAQLAQAQLEALRMQVHPHFLFNTLHAISALQLEEPETAQRMLVRLADFLRLTLEGAAVQEVSLRREVDFLARYLEIERIRFPKKLSVEFNLDPGVLEARVPNLILQPIVENAIRHGIALKTGPGRIEIGACARNGSLLLHVRDTGPGLNSSPAAGIGLTNTRERLHRMYGGAARLALQNVPGGGLEASIEIPLKREPSA